MSPATQRTIRGLLGVVGVLGIWELMARTGMINTLLLGSPTRIAEAGIRQLQSVQFWEHFGTSALEFVLGVGLSAAVGVLIGVLAGWYRRFNYLVDPWLTILYSTPTVAIAPLMILVFGIDLASKVAIIFLFAAFPIAVNTMVGVQTTANRYLRVARVFDASDATILRTVVLPGALPYILTGMRVAGGRALIGIVSAELLAGNAGIGYLLSLAGATFQTNTLMFLIAVIGMSGVAYTMLVKYMEERIERWRPVPLTE